MGHLAILSTSWQPPNNLKPNISSYSTILGSLLIISKMSKMIAGEPCCMQHLPPPPARLCRPPQPRRGSRVRKLEFWYTPTPLLFGTAPPPDFYHFCRLNWAAQSRSSCPCHPYQLCRGSLASHSHVPPVGDVKIKWNCLFSLKLTLLTQPCHG